MALELASRHPDRVRALVLLEAVVRGLAPAADEWLDALSVRVREAVARGGVDAAGEALVGAVLGEGAWESAPEGLRQMFTQNGPAILAEVQREAYEEVDAAALAAIDRPVLLVAAADSPPAFREMTEATTSALPDARTTLVSGGHMISPAEPEVLAFIEQALERR